MRRIMTLGVMVALLVALVTGTAFAHYLAYSAVDDQGKNEVMYYAVDPSAASTIQGKINNATIGTDSWDRLDCFYSSACAGVNWRQVTVAEAKAMDNALVIQAEPNSPDPVNNLYGRYQHRDGTYDDVTMFLDVMNRYNALTQQDMVLHETGHSLGLAHAPCTVTTTVMVTGCFNLLGHPGVHDRADYKTLWITNDGPGSFAVASDEGDFDSIQTSDGYKIDDYAG